MEQHPSLVALHNQASAHLQAGDYAAARTGFLAVAEAHRQADPVDGVELARTLTNLSVACTELGLDDEAQTHSADADRLLGPSAEDVTLRAAVLHNWAYSHKQAGRWSPALHGFQSALTLLEGASASPSLDMAMLLQEMASLLRLMRRPDEAFPHAYRCMTIRDGILGTVDAAVGQAAQLAGRVLVDQGDLPKAVGYLQPAHQIFARVLGTYDGTTIGAVHDLFTATWKTGDRQTVEGDLRTFIPAARKVGVRNSSYYVRELTDLAGILEANGSVEESLRTALDAADAAGQMDEPSNATLAPYYRDLAALLTRLGEPRRAWPLLERACRGSDLLIEQAVATREDSYRRTYLSALADETVTFVRHVADWCAGDPAAAAAAFHLIVNRKGLIAESTLAHDDERLGRTQPDLQPLLAQIRDQQQALLALHAAGFQDGARKKLIQQGAIEDRLRPLQGEVEMRTRPGNGPRPPRAGHVDVAAVADALPERSALVEYYALVPPREDPVLRQLVDDSGDDWLLPERRSERYVAIVVRAGEHDARFVDLGDGASLESLAYSCLAAMSGGRLDLIPRERQRDVSPMPEEDLSRGLRERLLDPIADALIGCTTVFIAPDGVICRVPFAALLDEAPSTTRLIDRLTIGYVPSGRSVLDFGAEVPEPGEPPVVVGDPDYDFDRPGTSREAPPLVDGFVDFYFERLPGTADEAWRISQLIGGRRLTRKAATEAALQACRSPAILHLATHGYYVRPFAQGMMVIGDWRREFGATFRGEVLGFAGQPFLRSGLALAGVNAWSEDRPTPEDVGDGLLSSADIARMDLAGTELVVLSACSGALGDVAPGDGVAGLLHGCRVAGAGAAVASLWPIPDEEATGELMTTFYRGLLQGLSRIEALRAAQAGIRATQPPWQWASYVLYGNPGPIRFRRPTDTSRSD